jgi:hypothetical protein
VSHGLGTLEPFNTYLVILCPDQSDRLAIDNTELVEMYTKLPTRRGHNPLENKAIVCPYRIKVLRISFQPLLGFKLSGKVKLAFFDDCSIDALARENPRKQFAKEPCPGQATVDA